MSRDEQQGFLPFDLTAPSKILYPVYTPLREHTGSVSVVPIGDENEAQFKRIICDDGTAMFCIEIPCEDMNHCHTCECSAQHYIAVSADQAAEIRRLTGD